MTKKDEKALSLAMITHINQIDRLKTLLTTKQIEQMPLLMAYMICLGNLNHGSLNKETINNILVYIYNGVSAVPRYANDLIGMAEIYVVNNFEKVNRCRNPMP